MKKGAINLSVNMIIVLIIAIVILGFALSFVQTMFGEVEDKFAQSFPEPKIDVSAERPVGVPNEIKFGPGETSKRISIRVFNTLNGPITDTSEGNVECNSIRTASFESMKIEAGQTKTIKTVLETANTITNNDICIVKFGTESDNIQGSFFVVKE